MKFLDRQIIESTINKFIPIGEIFYIKQINTGKKNYVYDITSKKGDFIIKIYSEKSHPSPTDMEYNILNFLYQDQFPVPRPLDFICDKNTSSILLEKLVGHSGNMRFVPRHLIPLLNYEAGQILGRLHSYSFDKYGFLNLKNGKLNGIDDSWKSFLYKEDKYFITCLENINYETISQDYKAVINKIRYSDSEKSLLHNDFNPSNAIFDKDLISGIIDFETSILGDPNFELLSIETENSWFKTPKEKDSFFKGYSEVRDIPSSNSDLKEAYSKKKNN